MVRFKNRYLLVELLPIPDTTEDLAPKKPAKKARLTDLVCEETPPVLQDDGKSLLDMNTLLNGLSSSNAASYIRQTLEHNFGVHAAAQNSQSFSVKYCNARTGSLIIRAARDSFKTIWATITFLTGLPSEVTAKQRSDASVKFIWSVVHTSGTIRSAQKNAIKRASKQIEKATSACTDQAKLKVLQDILTESQAALKNVEA